MGRRGLRRSAPVWLSSGALVQATVRFLPETGNDPDAGMLMMAAMMSVPSLIVLVPCGPSGLLAAEGPGGWNDAGPAVGRGFRSAF